MFIYTDMFCDDAVSFPPASKQDEQGDILAKDSQPPRYHSSEKERRERERGRGW